MSRLNSLLDPCDERVQNPKKTTPCSLAPPAQELHRDPLQAPNGLKNAATGHLYHHPSKNHKLAAEGRSECSQTVEEPAQVKRTRQSYPI